MKKDIRLPDFIIAGAHKSGTSALLRYLASLPGINAHAQIMRGVEPHFFSKNYERGIEWYAESFKDVPENDILGEKSVTYITDGDAAVRIKENIPNAKVIFLLRNPVTRCYSHYKANYGRGNEFFSFKNALKFEKTRSGMFKNNFAYLERGKYIEGIKPFLDNFPKENLMFLSTEEFQKNTGEVLYEVCQFLGLKINKEDITFPQQQFNVSKVPIHPLLVFPVAFTKNQVQKYLKIGFLIKFLSSIEQSLLLEKKFKKIKPEARQYLVDYYKPYNEELAAATGLDISYWK